MVEFSNIYVSPWYVRADANQVRTTGINKVDSAAAGTSPGNGFVDLPVAGRLRDQQLVVEGGYATKRGNFGVNFTRSTFTNDNQILRWSNPFFGGTARCRAQPARRHVPPARQRSVEDRHERRAATCCHGARARRAGDLQRAHQRCRHARRRCSTDRRRGARRWDAIRPVDQLRRQGQEHDGGSDSSSQCRCAISTRAPTTTTTTRTTSRARSRSRPHGGAILLHGGNDRRRARNVLRPGVRQGYAEHNRRHRAGIPLQSGEPADRRHTITPQTSAGTGPSRHDIATTRPWTSVSSGANSTRSSVSACGSRTVPPAPLRLRARERRLRRE